MCHNHLCTCSATVRLFIIDCKYLNFWVSWKSNSWNLGFPHFFQEEELHWTPLPAATTSPNDWQLSLPEFSYRNWHTNSERLKRRLGNVEKGWLEKVKSDLHLVSMSRKKERWTVLDSDVHFHQSHEGNKDCDKFIWFESGL